MAGLYFYYSSMNAGKSSLLLQSAHNYKERGMNPILLKPSVDDRSGSKITSRIGLSADVDFLIKPEQDVFSLLISSLSLKHTDCILVDEAQFLSPEQVEQLARLVDSFGVPVLCYGLRTDFQGNLFPGSAKLMAWADKLVEQKTICHCGRKANFVLRLVDGVPTKTGEQIQIGGNESYVSVCRNHWVLNDHSGCMVSG